MTAVCPNGHPSQAEDYCDVCGAPIDTAAQPRGGPVPATASAAPGEIPAPPPGASPGAKVCPNCATENVAEALFCEACGYDFTTGTLPRPEPATQVQAPTDDPGAAVAPPENTTTPRPPGLDAGSFGFVAEVWIDPAWYDAQQGPDPLPSPGPPEVIPLRRDSLLVGRVSRSRNIHPDIDCEPDSGVSRRQAQLTSDGTRWWVEDLESANGTFVAPGSDPVPEDPIPVGVKRELGPGDRVYVGAWTRIVIRPATPEEQESLV